VVHLWNSLTSNTPAWVEYVSVIRHTSHSSQSPGSLEDPRVSWLKSDPRGARGSSYLAARALTGLWLKWPPFVFLCCKGSFRMKLNFNKAIVQNRFIFDFSVAPVVEILRWSCSRGGCRGSSRVKRSNVSCVYDSIACIDNRPRLGLRRIISTLLYVHGPGTPFERTNRDTSSSSISSRTISKKMEHAWSLAGYNRFLV
jgi:hypothetical protein